jgi:hypothetical protein
MSRTETLISQLFSIRNKYGKKFSKEKLKLISAINVETLKSKRALQSWYDILLFLLAYPDNSSVYQASGQALQRFQSYVRSHGHLKDRLFNSGITNTNLCAAFGFEIAKWLRKNHPNDIRLSSFEADSGQIQSILSVVMPKVESEILQDGNSDWKSWLKGTLKKGEDILDRLIAIFDETDIRPEVKDELWNAIGINVEINFPTHLSLPQSLTTPYYHSSLIRKTRNRTSDLKFKKISLDELEARQIIECGRMILVRHLREIDPISFTAPALVSYYALPRGLTIALMGMVPERRHPIDSYMGYVVFKNGLPVAYAGSWILFDSGRIGLNVFPSYRGGESQYIFEQVLKLHQKVYRLRRFSVDPYQLGKDNDDGIRSGAFWVYYHAGFRPIRKDQRQLANAEAFKIKSGKNYRTPAPVLKKLADSRMELFLESRPARFDATDLSLAYARILQKRFDGNRKLGDNSSFYELATLLRIKSYYEDKMQFILRNWCVLLGNKLEELRLNTTLRKTLKKLFELKARGSEEEYISELQHANDLKKLLEKIVSENIV